MALTNPSSEKSVPWSVVICEETRNAYKTAAASQLAVVFEVCHATRPPCRSHRKNDAQSHSERRHRKLAGSIEWQSAGCPSNQERASVTKDWWEHFLACSPRYQSRIFLRSPLLICFCFKAIARSLTAISNPLCTEITPACGRSIYVLTIEKWK
jgi:hypothetical protein